MIKFDLIQLSKDHGFSSCYILDASFAASAPENVSTLLLLVYPYHSWGQADPGCVKISAYYHAAQTAYHNAKKLVQDLHEMGEFSLLCNDVRLKPILSHLEDFSQGRNTLHYHKTYGSRFHVQVIGLASTYPFSASIVSNPWTGMCGNCQKCIQACPGKALTLDGLVRDKCLRQHMMSGNAIPDHMRTLMGNRLLGCDICQQVCPYNKHLPDDCTNAHQFPIERLLKKDVECMASLSIQIGSNMSLPNRVCAQACIAAGNSDDVDLLPILAELCYSPSGTIADHAAWAVKMLSKQPPKVTF